MVRETSPPHFRVFDINNENKQLVGHTRPFGFAALFLAAINLHLSRCQPEGVLCPLWNAAHHKFIKCNSHYAVVSAGRPRAPWSSSCAQPAICSAVRTTDTEGHQIMITTLIESSAVMQQKHVEQKCRSERPSSRGFGCPKPWHFFHRAGSLWLFYLCRIL